MPAPPPPDAPATRDGDAPRRRATIAAALVVVLVTGLVVSRGDGLVADLAGGALYAALVQLLVLLAVPTVRPAVAGGVALATCVAVELGQLTPVPALLAGAWPPAALVLGTTFVVTDLLAYAAGVVVVGTLDAVRARPGP